MPPEYAQIEVSGSGIQPQEADAYTPDRAALSELEGSTPSRWSVTSHPEVTVWTTRLKRRFSELAAKYALNVLSPEESTEYAEMVHLRRRLNHPRSGTEVAVDYERRKALLALEDALRHYVYFFHEDSARR